MAVSVCVWRSEVIGKCRSSSTLHFLPEMVSPGPGTGHLPRAPSSSCPTHIQLCPWRLSDPPAPSPSPLFPGPGHIPEARGENELYRKFFQIISQRRDENTVPSLQPAGEPKALRESFRSCCAVSVEQVRGFCTKISFAAS